MSSRRNPPNPDEINDRLEAILERVERLEERTGLSTTAPDGTRVSFSQLLAVGLTRRQALAALGFVAAGATTAAAIGRSVATVEADDEDGEPDELDVPSIHVDESIGIGEYRWELDDGNGDDVLSLVYEP
ncbi:hypothetical protein [Natronococcus sp. A-GB7]|uniref:hypothetical protein n=1 Tax=Natronococcus sp. A-GB7 TaxID=3037649 RepID=UPI00241DEFB3|nr:hypothetical protein [Natronococcus sp. A-GB7]MDG5819726.1 hypothetical protein [Natronococcus sp. A-GB7]